MPRLRKVLESCSFCGVYQFKTRMLIKGPRRTQQQAIARLPAWTAPLTLKDAKLMAEKEYLGLEAGLGAAADDDEIEEQAEQAVEQGHEHDLASSQARLLAQISSQSEFLHPTAARDVLRPWPACGPGWAAVEGGV